MDAACGMYVWETVEVDRECGAEGKTLGIYRSRWEDNIKVDIEEVGLKE
jgi:hypothetical protein